MNEAKTLIRYQIEINERYHARGIQLIDGIETIDVNKYCRKWRNELKEMGIDPKDVIIKSIIYNPSFMEIAEAHDWCKKYQIASKSSIADINPN